MAKKKTSEVEIEGRKVRVEAAEGGAVPEWSTLKVVGQPVRRIDGRVKVTGQAMFTADVVLPRMAHARFVRSSRAHARVVSIDTKAAATVPGVLAIVRPEEWSGKSLKDPLDRPLPILTDEPKYFGEEILVVCAEDEDSARRAAARVRIVYEDLPHVLDPEEAVKAGRYVGGGWTRTKLGRPAIYSRGNVKRGMAQAARVFERTYRTASMVHSSIEPHGAVASYENGKWTVWESTQGVFAVREQLAELLGAPVAEVRVTCPYPGGGFGGKVAAGKYTFAAAELSRRLGRPVRMVQSRAEEFVSPYGRPPSIQHLKIGVKSNGKLAAIEQTGIHAVGPYEFGAEWGHAEDMITEMYDCQNVHTESFAALTNTPPPCAMRAPGYAQGAFALEQMMDEIAQALDIDPVELRLRNIPEKAPDSGKPYAAPVGRHGLRECLKTGAEMFGWEGRKPSASVDGRIKKGVGVAATVWGGGGGPPASCTVRLHADATAEIFAGAADIGTGIRTALAQIVAEELDLKVENIRVVNADTDLTSYALPSYGSLTLASSGPAARRAAIDCKRQIMDLAGSIWRLSGSDAKRVSMRDGMIVRAATESEPEWMMPTSKVLSSAPGKEIVGRGDREANPALALKAFGVQFAAVAVDTETGRITVEELVAVNDSGRVINRLLFESQVAGGATMGLGMALLEERVFDPRTGIPLNPNWSDYKLPTIMDQPDKIQVGAAETPYSGNTIGAKGLGEPPLIPTSPAVANAVARAAGVRIAKLPMSPKRVLDTLGDAP